MPNDEMLELIKFYKAKIGIQVTDTESSEGSFTWSGFFSMSGDTGRRAFTGFKVT